MIKVSNTAKFCYYVDKSSKKCHLDVKYGNWNEMRTNLHLRKEKG